MKLAIITIIILIVIFLSLIFSSPFKPKDDDNYY